MKRDIANWLKSVTGKEGVHYYEVGEGEYVIARSKEEAWDHMNEMTEQDKNVEVRQLDDLDSFDNGIVLKFILESEKIPAFTHSSHSF